MPIISYNDGWMLYNAFLAVVAVGFGFAFLSTQQKYLKAAFGVLWLLFLPNTLYIFTDLIHLIEQWHEISPSLLPLLLTQYALFELIGVMTFLIAVLPFERIIGKIKELKKRSVLLLILFNAYVAYGMVLGRVERLNSWDIFTDPARVIQSGLHVLFSLDLLGLTILFGLLCNFIYFLFREALLRRTKGFF